MSKADVFKFSIVTPSYKQPMWLRLCAASVADQDAPGIEVEHIVQDSLSGPEIADAVKDFPELKLVSEKDKGMYDAINRGWEKATGDVLCWLNCDEQYLPGVLKDVADYFRAHPETEVLFADAIIVDNDGKYLCSRRVLTPQLYHTWTCHLATFSCSTFFRRNVIKEKGFALDARWRALGDADLIARMIRAGVRMAVLRRYTSSFVDTGENISVQPWAIQERMDFKAEAPRWVRKTHRVWMLIHRVRRLLHGIYTLGPFAYDIFTPASPRKRLHFAVSNPTFYWSARMQ
jgi:glycosyltransferase involved in cell wall biosynthesis